MFFDPMYFVFVGPAMLLAMYAQWKVSSAYSQAREVGVSSGLTGAEAAREILARSGLEGLRIEPVEGTLSDHYDPTSRTLRLSHDVYHGRTLAAVGIAAHEAGHALQHGQGYTPLVIRNGIVPLAALGGNASWFLLMAGFLFQASGLILLGIIAFSLTVVFQLVNLPVEFDASRRARELLQRLGIVRGDEDREVGRVLSAAALTYVAGTLTSVLTLLYYLSIFNRSSSDEA